ncbi:hypothetical protein PRIPAC_77121, partial [Pristionchus pacificus]|uniref:Nanos-type domain-containing protein n=1 Tax=Pristionchus pacificus TaxID=54126 RepID=A0A2A6BWL9_PRIPA
WEKERGKVLVGTCACFPGLLVSTWLPLHYVTIADRMKTVLQLQSQDVRRRGPAKYVPQCDPKLRPKKEDNIVPKIHLSYIPPSLRRPSPWGAFLSDWLAACEEKRNSESASSAVSEGSPPLSPRYPEDEAGSTSGRSTGSSGACSGDTVTTDFSSVSSPRNIVEYRTAHPVIRQSQPAAASGAARYPFRGGFVPRAASTGANLSPAQWAELAALQQAAVQRQQLQLQPGGGAHHAPPKLMNIHTAYLPDLDAAVRQMMQQRKPAPASPASRPGSPPNGQPWLPHSHYYPTDPRNSIRGASSTGSDSAHYSDCRDRTQTTCDFCYQFAVHEAVSKEAAHLPRLTDRGPWRGHPTKQGDIIVCPRLLRRVCSMCGATGQAAHQTNLCPATNRKTSRY